MKKILLIVLFLSLCYYSFGQQMYMLEVTVDGTQITGADKLQKGDVSWTVKNEASGQILDDTYCYVMGADFTDNYWMFSTEIFSPQPVVGQQITFSITINNGKYAGYSGTKTYTIQGIDIDDIVDNGDGFYISSGPVVEPSINTVTPPAAFCEGTAGKEIQLKIDNTPANWDGYTIDWGDPAITTSVAGLGATITGNIATSLAAGNHSLTVSLKKGDAVVDSKNYTVKVHSKPTVTISAPKDYICNKGADNSSLTLTASGASTYTWTAPTNTPGATRVVSGITAATTYTVEGKDANGCTNTASKEITPYDAPTASIEDGYITDACAGGEEKKDITLNGSGTAGSNGNSFTYTWEGPGSGAKNGTSFTVNEAKLANGNNPITFQVNDGKCTSTKANANVTGHELKVNISGTSPVNYGTSTTLTANATGTPDPTYTYAWTGGVFAAGADQTQSSVTTGAITQENTYKVTVTDKYCKVSATKKVNYKGGPVEVVPVGNKDLIVCQVATPLSVNITNGSGNSKITWSSTPALTLSPTDQATTTIAAGNPVGLYTVTCKVEDGADIKTVNFNVSILLQPTLTGIGVSDIDGNAITGGYTLLTGSELILTGQGITNAATYEWTPADKFAVGQGTDQATTVPLPKSSNINLILTVKNAEGKCPVSKSISVSVSGDPIEILQNDVSDCAGTDIALDAKPTGGSGTYKSIVWSCENPDLKLSATTGQKVTVGGTTPAGTYTVKIKVTDSKDHVKEKEITVTVKPKPELTAVGSTSLTANVGDSKQLEVNLAPNTISTNSISWSAVAGAPGSVLSDTKYSAGPFAVAGMNKYTASVTYDGCAGTPVEFTVTVDMPLDIEIEENPKVCEGTSLQLTASPTGGSGDYENPVWECTNPDLKLSATTGGTVTVNANTPAGVYTVKVKVKDSKGNPKEKTITVTVKPKPVLTAVGATSLEANVGDTKQLEVSLSPSSINTSNIVWTGTPGKKLSDVQYEAGPFTTGGTKTYTASATYDGCPAEPVEFTVKVATPDDPIEITTELSPEVCEGNSLKLTASAKGGNGTLSYTWEVLTGDFVLSPLVGNSTTVPSDLPAGVYKVRVTVKDEKGNSEHEDINVRIKAKPVINSLVATNSTTGATVSGSANLGDILKLTATVTPSAATCTWTGAHTNPGASDKEVLTDALSSTGSYTYIVTADAEGCKAEERIAVIVDASEGAQLRLEIDEKCREDGNLTLTMTAFGGDNFSFNLVKNDGSVSKSYTGKGPWVYSIPVSGEGTYYVTDFKAFKNTVEIIPASVKPASIRAYFEIPPPITIEGGNVQQKCEGEEMTLTVRDVSDVTYTWDKGVKNGEPFIPAGSDVYTVNAISKKGCRATSTVNVTVVPKPHVVAMGGGEICLGDTIRLTADGSADSYQWSNGATGKQVTVKPVVGGTLKYVVTGVEDVNGCKDTAVVNVVVNEPPKILSASKQERNIAIGKNATFWVKVTGKHLSYQWQRKEGDSWNELYNTNSDFPLVSGANADTLKLSAVPQSWDGTELRCIVTNPCGQDDTTFVLHVNECFMIDGRLVMEEGIIPDDDPNNKIDGWYCIGTRISLRALITSEEDYEIENAHYTWSIDGLDLPEEHFELESDTAVLSWIPQYQEDDIVVKVCMYCDGACEEICPKYIRLKARKFEDVVVKIQSSIDPSRKFCPGDTVTFNVMTKNAGLEPTFTWYNDAFKLPGEQSPMNELISYEEQEVTLVMGQKDTWMRLFMRPSAEICAREPLITDTLFLEKKDFVKPSLHIENNTGDTLACRGDEITFHAVWENAGEHPRFEWRKDIWDLGTDEYAIAKLDDKDMWIKCRLTPGDDVCFEGNELVDTMVIRIVEDAAVKIYADMEGKVQGDEILFTSEVQQVKMNDNWSYEWWVNNGLRTECEEEEYLTDILRQGDSVQCSIRGQLVCQHRIYSNTIYVDYTGGVSRDTMLYIYREEQIRDLDMARSCDVLSNVIFSIDIPAGFGMASISPDGKFNYIPNRDFVGTDYVKYVVRNKADKKILAVGYIYVTVKDTDRFMVPNLITPNNDGLNDTWKLDFLKDYPEHMITLYNRNGKIVFRADHYQNDWDGTGKGDSGYVAYFNLANGVYTYVIDLGNKEILKGWLEIRRDMNRGKYSR